MTNLDAQCADAGSNVHPVPWPACILVLLFCAMVLAAGMSLVGVGLQGVINQRLVITTRSGGVLRQTVSTSTAYTGLAAVRVGLGMMAGGSLLASLGVAWALSVIMVWRRGVAAYRPHRLLWWLSLLVLTFLFLLPPWVAANAVMWIAVIAALVLLGAQRRAGAASSIGRAIFVAAIAFGLVAPVSGWNAVFGLSLLGGGFAHLFTLRLPRPASWTAQPGAPH